MEKHIKEKKYFDIDDKGGLKEVPRQKPVRQKNITLWTALGLYGNIGISIVIPLLAGTFAGLYLDKKLGYEPVLTFSGISIGFIVSIVSLYGIFRKFSENSKK